MYHIDDDDHITCNESNPSRNRRDNDDEKKVIELLHQANIFNVNQQADVPERLQNMVTKDLATTDRRISFEGKQPPPEETHNQKSYTRWLPKWPRACAKRGNAD